MNWKAIRLELARTADHPLGSASRAYLLRLPLAEDGSIDARAIQDEPARATVRRHWPNQRDMAGQIVQTPSGWAFNYEPGEADDQVTYHLESHKLRIGACVTLTEPDGRRLPFRVAAVSGLG
jgi:hypothetical protein